MATEYLVRSGDREQRVTIVEDLGDRALVLVGERRLEVAVEQLPDGRIALVDDTGRHVFRPAATPQGTLLVTAWRQHALEVRDARTAWLGAGARGKGGAGGRIAASMPGRVARLPVRVGDAVAEGDVVAVLEAMKMENDVRAPAAGRVVVVAVTEGAAVEAGALLVQLEPMP